MKTKISILFILIIGLLETACIKRAKLSSVPHIEFISYTRDLENSADHLVFSFTDKDGDIGKLGARTCEGQNIIFQTYEKIGNIYQLLPPTDISMCYAIDYLSTEQEKATQGEIDVSIEHFGFPQGQGPIVKFTVYIVDLAKNKSNVIETPDIQVP